MNTQLPMTFAPYVRTSETSREAAKLIEPHLSALQAKVLSYIHRSEGCTDAEGALGTGLDGSTYRPRRIELADMGKIRADGTKLNGKGRRVTIWRAV